MSTLSSSSSSSSSTPSLSLNEAISSIFLELLSALIHTALRYRKIYPEVLFQQRALYGISVWQCRHNDVCVYITTVLDNMKPLLESGLLDRVLMTTFKSDGNVLDQLVIKCCHLGVRAADDGSSSSITQNMILAIEDEARSAILKMSMLDVILPQVSDGCTWQIMLITKSEVVDANQSTILTNALKDGNWYTENSYLPEVRRSSSTSSPHNSSNNNDNEVDGGEGRTRKRGHQASDTGTIAIKNITTDLMKIDITIEKH